MKIRQHTYLAVVFLAVAVIVQSAEEPHQFNPEQFERPERAKYQKPDEVVAALHLKPGNVVADIGAGSGYFSRRFAGAVAPGGIVYAVDIDENMLRYIQDRARSEKQSNLVTVLCSEQDPMLAPASVDLIFICDTIHHIAERDAYYKRLHGVLRPGGRLAIVDFKKGPLPIGPPDSIKIARDSLIQEVTAGGFVKAEEFDFLPYQYFVVFKAE